MDRGDSRLADPDFPARLTPREREILQTRDHFTRSREGMSALDQFLIMLRREYVERITSRSFLVITLLLLALTTAVPVLPALLGGTLKGTAAVAVADETG